AWRSRWSPTDITAWRRRSSSTGRARTNWRNGSVSCVRRAVGRHTSDLYKGGEKIMKMIRGGCLAVIGLLTFAGTASAGEDLPIGAIGSLSGGATDWGVATQRGVQLAI